MEERERKIFWTALLALTLAGGIARVVGCFWGYPLLLHPDESATVDYAIDLLSRHSWMAASFDRPDHFEIKCDALLFAIFSRIRYGVPAYQAFSEHTTAFYIVGRMLAAAFGTALIPLVSLFAMDVLREKPFRFRCPVALFAGLIGGNVLLSGLTEAKALTVPDTRNRSLEAVTAMGITPENTLYEGYTPFAPADYTDLSDAFEWVDGEIRPKADYAGKRYFMMSDSFYGRYRGDLQRYGDRAAVYSAIEEQYALVYRLVPDDDHPLSPYLLRNLPRCVRYLLRHTTCGGSAISVFDLTERLEK